MGQVARASARTTSWLGQTSKEPPRPVRMRRPVGRPGCRGRCKRGRCPLDSDPHPHPHATRRHPPPPLHPGLKDLESESDPKPEPRPEPELVWKGIRRFLPSQPHPLFLQLSSCDQVSDKKDQV